MMRIFALVLSVCLTSTPSALAQTQVPPPPDQVFSVTTQLVVVDAAVRRKKAGLAAPSLKAEDFEIYEDGVRRPISFFSRDKLPLSIVLLFDLTLTVLPVLKPLAAGAQAALGHLQLGRVRLQFVVDPARKQSVGRPHWRAALHRELASGPAARHCRL